VEKTHYTHGTRVCSVIQPTAKSNDRSDLSSFCRSPGTRRHFSPSLSLCSLCSRLAALTVRLFPCADSIVTRKLFTSVCHGHIKEAARFSLSFSRSLSVFRRYGHHLVVWGKRQVSCIGNWKMAGPCHFHDFQSRLEPASP
jgi:hypothetical protein